MPTGSLNIEQGDIIVANLLYSDQVGIKPRPLLVISNSGFNRESDDIIALKITSADHQTHFDVLLTNQNLASGKLQNDSFIMVDFPATIQKSTIFKKIAKISSLKLAEVKTKLKELFGL